MSIFDYISVPLPDGSGGYLLPRSDNPIADRVLAELMLRAFGTEIVRVPRVPWQPRAHDIALALANGA